MAGIRVTVGGTPAPILYAQDRQINFVVPQHLTGNSTNICIPDAQTLSCLFVLSTPLGLGVFGAGSAIVNEDGTVNSPANPAARGSVISSFGTGMGPYSRAGPDGSIAQPPLGLLLDPVGVTFYGPTPYPCFVCHPQLTFPGDVTYAGQAPDMVTGVAQLNVRVPADAIPGLRVQVGVTVLAPGGNGGAFATVVLK